jgi:hypothetical protein
METHCSIPPMRTFSNRSMPFALTILRAFAMMAAACARLKGFGADLSAERATVSARSKRQIYALHWYRTMNAESDLCVLVRRRAVPSLRTRAFKSAGSPVDTTAAELVF